MSSGFYKRKGKRLFDYIISIIGIFVLSPIFVVLSIAILIEDGRPIIFRQKRVGKDGKQFMIYKFRSMAKNVGDVPSSKAVGLPITKVGRTIRRLSLDELPQLINTLKGDMSVVGPRASLQSQVYLNKLREKHGILDLKPGLTGLAQINSYDGMPEDEKVFWDKKYAEKITFINDIKIMLMTFAYLLKPPPVY